jgi:hypothetical protein
MFAIIHLLATFIADLFKSRRRLEVENLFLRHQLNIALRRAPPPSQGWRLFRERQLSILDRRRGPSMNACLHRKARLPFLKPDLAPNPIFAGHSYDCEGSELSVP